MLSDKEYVSRLGKLYGKVLSLRKDSDYVINQGQMDKLLAVLNFFVGLSGDLDGKVEPLELIPREENGGVTATFPVFDVYGDQVTWFCNVMSGCSAITIDPTDEGVCISCTIPDVFVRRIN